MYAILSEAVVLAWRLCPDITTGLQMLLDQFAEGPSQNIGLVAQDESMLTTIKSIASLRHSTNNPFCLGMLTTAAKTILSRVQTPGQSFHAGTVSGPAAQLDLHASQMGFPSLFPRAGTQPLRRGNERNQEDRRRLCERPECAALESGATKFGKCSRCKKVAYCGKDCQKLDWARHKGSCKKAAKKEKKSKKDSKSPSASNAAAAPASPPSSSASAPPVAAAAAPPPHG